MYGAIVSRPGNSDPDISVEDGEFLIEKTEELSINKFYSISVSSINSPKEEHMHL